MPITLKILNTETDCFSYLHNKIKTKITIICWWENNINFAQQHGLVHNFLFMQNYLLCVISVGEQQINVNNAKLKLVKYVMSVWNMYAVIVNVIMGDNNMLMRISLILFNIL